MKSIIRWAVMIEGSIPRLAGGGNMTYIWNDKMSATDWSLKTGQGKPVKVAITKEG
jgi:hypothetical protein